MSGPGEEFGVQIKKRSGWLIPLGVFVVTAALSALILAYYLAPAPTRLLGDQPAPSDSTVPVTLSIAGKGFHIPANYILFASARKGGALKGLELVALLPDLQGYTLATAQEFASAAPDSRVVNLAIREETSALSERDRLDRAYLPLVENRDGVSSAYSLTEYAFRADSVYRNEELFVGEADDGQPVLLRCEHATPDVPSPNCTGDLRLPDSLSLSYRFKRSHLDRWHDIDSGVRALAGAFMDKS